MTGGRARAVTTVALAVFAGVVAWVVGVSLAQSAVIAAVAVAVGAGADLVPLARDVTLPSRLVVRRSGTRRDVAGLSGALTGRKGMVTYPTAQRIRALAENRLALAGVDLHDPRHAGTAAGLLGPGAYAALIAGPEHPMRYSTLVRCVAALERLDDRTPTSAPRSAA